MGSAVTFAVFGRSGSQPPGAHALDQHDAADHHEANHIRCGAGDHHAQTTGSHRQTEQHGDLLIDEAVQSRSHTKQTDEGADLEERINDLKQLLAIQRAL